jgi:putative ABC transport system substrate-binding protein
MKQRIFLPAISVLLFAICVSAYAQQPKRIPRIGYLSARDRSADAARADAIRQGLRQLGYIEGQNIVIEYRYADGRRERFDGLISELVRLKVDLIVIAGGDAPVRSAMNATKTIPIVMSGGGGDPVTLSLVENLARPGGNVTGITNLTGELGGKRLELLKQVIPKLARVAVLYEPANPSSVIEIKERLPGAARVMKLTLQPFEIRAADELENVFTAQMKERPDGLYVSPGALVNTHRKRIVELALNSRLASIYPRREYALEGGLMSYDADIAEGYRRVAYYVDKILKGAKPADLPVEQPTKFELVINLNAAKQIGLTIPLQVLARAHRIIK